MTGGGAFSNSDHLLAHGEERRDGQKNWDDAKNYTLKGLVGELLGANRHQILTSQKHKCMDERTRYYSIRYSTVGYRIS